MGERSGVAHVEIGAPWVAQSWLILAKTSRGLCAGVLPCTFRDLFCFHVVEKRRRPLWWMQKRMWKHCRQKGWDRKSPCRQVKKVDFHRQTSIISCDSQMKPSEVSYIHIYIYTYLHSGFPSHMDDFCWLASTSTLPSSFSGTSFDTSSVSCSSASSLKRVLRQPMRLAGQLRLGCVSDRGLTMLMKVLCTWPNGCLFVPLLFGPSGRFRRLRCHAVWKVVKSKEPFFFKTAKATG